MREAGVIVTLDGHGGDELFSGYEFSILHSIPDSFLNFSRLKDVLSTYREIHPENEQFKGMNNVAIMLYLIKASYSQKKRLKKTFKASSFESYDNLNMHLLDLSFCTIMPTLLRNYDRYSMMSGVEIRIPLLDYRIVEFAFSINNESKIRNGYSKSILRDVSSDWLPERIIKNKQKIGFAPPIFDWIKGPLKDFILDEIHSINFNNSSLINSKKLKNEIEDLMTNPVQKKLYDTEKIWKSFNIFLWEKAFLGNNKKIV
jgi:asparagine synthase (glutamine-hydrolysing)